MPYDEFIMWQSYFDKRPLGWREDQRFSKIMQCLGVKAKPESIFYSLHKLSAAIDEDREREHKIKKGQISIENLKNSVFFRKLLGSQEGKDIWSNHENTPERNAENS